MYINACIDYRLSPSVLSVDAFVFHSLKERLERVAIRRVRRHNGLQTVDTDGPRYESTVTKA